MKIHSTPQDARMQLLKNEVEKLTGRVENIEKYLQIEVDAVRPDILNNSNNSNYSQPVDVG